MQGELIIVEKENLMMYFCIVQMVRKYIALFVLLSLLISCAVSSGSLNKDVIAVEKKVAQGKEQEKSEQDSEAEKEEEQEEQEEPVDEEEEESGLRIVTNPERAEVFINNRYVGFSPIFITDMEEGTYKITLRKSDYKEVSLWVEYDGDLVVYDIELQQKTGFLLVKTIPENAHVIVGGETLPASFEELPIGRYRLRVQAFGYDDYETTILIQEDRLEEIEVALEEAEFAILNMHASRNAFNPRNPGLLGTSRIAFRVSTYGTGFITVINQEGITVHRHDLQPFRSWDQHFVWDGRGENDQPLPDGRYRIVVNAAGKTGVNLRDSITLSLSSSLVINYRNVWSGNSGLLYTTTNDILPPLSFQISSLALGHIVTDGATEFRTPVNLSLRTGITEGIELNIVGGIILENTGLTPLYASVSSKLSLFGSHNAESLKAALTLKIAYQHDSPMDIFTNFTGVSIGMPFEVPLGVFALLYTPELSLSPWDVVYDPTEIGRQTDEEGLFLRMYQRLGFLIDVGNFVSGLSIAVRSKSLIHEFSFFDPPLQGAFELSWMIPQTQLFISFAIAGEFAAFDNYYLLGGGGLGFLF